MATFQLIIIQSHKFMKKSLYVFSVLMSIIISCQSHKFRCLIIIENCQGNEELQIYGTLCNDSIFYFDNMSRDTINNTKGLEGGRVLLYNEKGVVLGQLPVIGPHEQDLSKILGPCIYCFPDGRLVCKQGYFIFPRSGVDNEEKK